jgi:hypothetical protein
VVPAKDVQLLKEQWIEENQYAVYYSNEQERASLAKFRNAWYHLDEAPPKL